MLRPYCLPLLLGATLLAPLACKSDSSETVTDGEASTSATTSTNGTTSTPTTSNGTTASTPTTSGEPTTTEGTTAEATTTVEATTTTGGPPAVSCATITDEIVCKNEETCKWGGVLSYAYGNQGCQGSITPACVDKAPAGAATAWYRELENDVQVVEFTYTPELDPEWKQCDCDGPLACLCTSVTEACPERQEDYCGFIATEIGCENVTFMGNKSCNWFKVWPEGPNDDMCTQNLSKDRCLPSAGPFADTCKMDQTALPPFGGCNPMAVYDPTYWREVDGIVEIVTDCTPPTGFTRCKPDDPDQPIECTCNCQ